MPGSGIELNEINAAAAALELKVVPFEMQRAEDIAAAFEAFDGRVEAVYVVGDAFASANRIALTRLRSPRVYLRCARSATTSKWAV